MQESHNFLSFLTEHLQQFFQYTAFANFTLGHLVMIVIGLALIFLAIFKGRRITIPLVNNAGPERI